MTKFATVLLILMFISFGNCFAQGNTYQEKQDSKIFKMYLNDAKKGNAVYQSILGDYYLKGKGVKADTTQALLWYRKSAEQKHALSCYNLGNCYEKGIGVKVDGIEAIKWYQLAGNYGYSLGYGCIGNIYESGCPPVKIDKKTAVIWYRKDPSFLGTVGLIKLKEVAIYMDIEQAAMSGNTASQLALGDIYKKGSMDIPQNASEAFKWYSLAAEGNEISAMYQVGECFELGFGVAQNISEAIKWYQKVVDNGESSALLSAKTALDRINPDSEYSRFLISAKNENLNGKKVGKWVELENQNFSKDSIKYRVLTEYKDNLPIGIQKKYDMQGRLAELIPYKNGKKNGLVKGFYPNGQLKSETTYINDKKEGLAKSWYEDGKLFQETRYQNDKLEGISKIYSLKGALESTTEYKNNQPDGLLVNYYENGQIKIELPYINGSLNGVSRHYNEKGKLGAEVDYVNNLMHGEMRLYHENGTLYHSNQYAYGLQVNISKTYDKNGNLYMETPILHGKPHGLQKTYHPNGKLASEIPYLNGKMHGISKQYNETGQLTAEIPFMNGEQNGKVHLNNKNEREQFLKDLFEFVSIALPMAETIIATNAGNTSITNEMNKQNAQIDAMQKNKTTTSNYTAEQSTTSNTNNTTNSGTSKIYPITTNTSDAGNDAYNKSAPGYYRVTPNPKNAASTTPNSQIIVGTDGNGAQVSNSSPTTSNTATNSSSPPPNQIIYANPCGTNCNDVTAVVTYSSDNLFTYYKLTNNTDRSLDAVLYIEHTDGNWENLGRENNLGSGVTSSSSGLWKTKSMTTGYYIIFYRTAGSTDVFPSETQVKAHSGH